MHELNLYRLKSNNCKVISIQDISAYDNTIAITNPTIKFRIPGIDCDFFPTFAVSGTSFFTSNSFGITNASCNEDLQELPDGIYEYTYSVCPNEEVYVNGRFLRTCKTRSLIVNFIGQNLIELSCNDCCNKQNLDKEKEYRDYLLILEAAENDVFCNRINEANIKMNYLNSKLNSL